MSLGYASVNDVILNVEGTIEANINKSIFISDIISSNDTNAIINTYDQTVFNGKIKLSDNNLDSSESFEITLFNNTSNSQYFKEIKYMIGENTYDNENIVFYLDGLNSGEEIKSNESKTFSIIFKYSDTYKTIEHTESLNNELNFVINIFFGYYVKFNLNGGSGDTLDYFITPESNLKEITFDKPIRDGYAFLGWYDKQDFLEAQKYYNEEQHPSNLNDLELPSGNIELYAGWKSANEITTTIAYHYNYSNYTISNVVSLHYGETKQLPIRNITRPCFNYVCLNTKEDGTGIDYNYEDSFTNDYVFDREVILYAKWDPIIYTIIVHPGEIKGVPVADEDYILHVKYGDKVNLTQCFFTPPEKFRFQNYVTTDDMSYSGWTWSGTWSYPSGSYHIKDDILELTATYYEVFPYKVIYHANGGEGEDVIKSYNEGDPITIIQCPFTREGYTFKCWGYTPDATNDPDGWTNWSGTWKYKNGQYHIANNELHFYAVWIKNEE